MNVHKNLLPLALIAGFAAAQMGLPASLAASAGSPQAEVAQGKAELAKGKLDKAIEILGHAANVLGTAPGSCDCHYNLGMALSKRAKSLCTSDKSKSNADYSAAKKELRTAIRVGEGNVISKRANDYLMSNLPKNMLQPRSGDGTEMIAARLGLRSADRGLTATPKAKVFEFYANWCEPCKQLKPVLAKIQQQYGDRIEVQSIDVDDKNNAEIVDQYDVSPIPTVIYLNPDGQVVGYSIGFAGEQTIQRQVQKILPDKT